MLAEEVEEEEDGVRLEEDLREAGFSDWRD